MTYKVVVATGDKLAAGTDADVSITLIGENGKSGKQALKMKGINLFERKQIDTFHLDLEDLGKIQFNYRILVVDDKWSWIHPTRDSQFAQSRFP